MRGILDLSALLAELEPELMPGEFVFCSLPEWRKEKVLEPEPIGWFQEREGLSVILRKETAETKGLAFELLLRQITLNVYSDLAAVGLTSAVATELSAQGISANMVAGFFHDHIFVPSHDAARAMLALKMLQSNGGA